MNSIAQQMNDALMIMVLGMGLVFVFLSMLILAISLVAWKFGPEQSTTASTDCDIPESSQAIEPKLVAAITAAIHQYRANA
ncbi:OadG family protein [Shewanella algidipiscicola]|uniref:Probable oxaloacetate decarboxylase gamma chain n=1 Tax=Shewanella algidipiscicola TaxID=614070 RepID=A0ABQ4P8P4_9GAMM|nr:OadG family transporter subunit [Shewanella algidipiscicola]GIU43914.1 hypothetical protein TUM4630_08370 [Shewanella algidipiscicola]